MIMFRATMLSIALVAASCTISKTYPVIAKSTLTDQELVGTATSTLEGGSFTMLSSRGATCTGIYDVELVSDATTGVLSHGELRCDDGRKGTWSTSGTVQGGQGFATVGDEKFRVFFGDVARVSSF